MKDVANLYKNSAIVQETDIYGDNADCDTEPVILKTLSIAQLMHHPVSDPFLGDLIVANIRKIQVFIDNGDGQMILYTLFGMMYLSTELALQVRTTMTKRAGDFYFDGCLPHWPDFRLRWLNYTTGQLKFARRGVKRRNAVIVAQTKLPIEAILSELTLYDRCVHL